MAYSLRYNSSERWEIARGLIVYTGEISKYKRSGSRWNIDVNCFFPDNISIFLEFFFALFLACDHDKKNPLVNLCMDMYVLVNALTLKLFRNAT